MRPVRATFVAFLVSTVTACGGTDPSISTSGAGSTITSTGGAGGGAPAAAGFELWLSAPRALVHVMDSYSLTVTITREAGFDGAVEIKVVGLPQGVTASPLTLAAGQNQGTLTITAAASAQLGEAPLKIVAGNATFALASDFVLLVAGAPGTLDPTFGDAGVAHFQSDWVITRARAQRGGGILFTTAGGTTGGVGRALSDGTLDAQFGNGGVRFIQFDPNATAWALKDVAEGADGSIVAVGYYNGPSAVALTAVRLRPDGSLDPSFGQGGKVEIPFAAMDARGTDVAIQIDGKIVIAGFTMPPGSNQRAIIVRLLPDGSPDASFGWQGTVQLDQSGASTKAAGMAIQLDGKVVIGEAWPANEMCAVRVDDSGVPDPGFGIGGRACVSLPQGAARTTAIALQPDSKLLLGGGLASSSKSAFARLLPDGSPDVSFGGSGVASFDTIDWVVSLTPQVDGKVVALSSVSGGSGHVSRLTPDGAVDESFGTGGVAPSGPNASMHLDAEGRIVTAGGLKGDSKLARHWP